MPLPAWPGTVPYVPKLDDFEVSQLYTPPTSNPTEDGPPIVRRWASANITKLSYVLVLTQAQKDDFVTFVRDTLDHGTSRFTMQVANRGDGTSSGWPSKTCWLEGGKVQGPKPYGDRNFLVKFDLNVLDWATDVIPQTSGVLSATEAPDTASFGGTSAPPSVSGAFSATEARDTASFAGTATPPTPSGALDATEAHDTASFAGAVGGIPAIVSAPVISGSESIGGTLGGSDGTWSNSPSTITHQWFQAETFDGEPVLEDGLLAGTPISGATSLNYTLASGDMGERLYREDTASNTFGSATAQSNVTGVVTAAISEIAATYFAVNGTWLDYTGHTGDGAGLRDGIDTGSSSIWGSANGTQDSAIIAVLGGRYAVDKIRVMAIPASAGWGSLYLNGASRDVGFNLTDWTNIGTVSGVTDGAAAEFSFGGAVAEYVQIRKPADWLGIADLRVFGALVSPVAGSGWSGTDKDASISRTNAGRTAVASLFNTQAAIRGTQGRSAGKVHIEFVINHIDTMTNASVGLANSSEALNDYLGRPGSKSFGLYHATAQGLVLVINDGTVAVVGSRPFDWDVIALEVDFTAGICRAAVNNDAWSADQDISAIIANAPLFPAFQGYRTGDAVTLRTRASDFSRAVSAGFSEWG